MIVARRILYTRHARQRMILRGISEREVNDALRKGIKRTQDGKIVVSYMYFEVVYVVRGEDVWVITVQFRW
ncbi:MAG: hypothetical protein A3K66_03710 [Euryarchaeota archaeon RBG_16_67_27]|nr:MAG: hypothetical protein A3K66_03710 [Euryarchaeota archaeon RBG_16_67_27]